MLRKPVRVMLVDDSPLALVLLQRMLAASPEIEVVGVATHGRQALDLIPHIQPDVVCTDYHMPDMNGLELIREIMARFPVPILVVSSAVERNDSDRIFSLLEAGAVDVFPKPLGGPGANEQAAEMLVNKIKIVAGVFVYGRNADKSRLSVNGPSHSLKPKWSQELPKIVAIGASTGGPQALLTILSSLPAKFPVPILCVQHISIGFLPGLVSWLGNHFKGKVLIASDKEYPRPGNVYFPQEDTHLQIDAKGRLRMTNDLQTWGHRPSVSVMFRSVSSAYGNAAVGVLLTGMGHDGGDGMQVLAEGGALTICQNEATCVIYGMPRDAVERGAARVVLPLDDIASALVAAVNQQPPLLGRIKHGIQ